LLSDAEMRFAEKDLGIPRERLWRTSPVIDTQVRVLPRAPRRDVLVLGAASWRKGGDVAVRVLDAVLRADASTTATWHGLDDVDAVAAALGDDVRDRADLAGPYSRADLGGLLSGHRVLLFASRSEGLPVTLLEALRAGIAVVGADVAGVSELLGSGAGMLVPDGHVDGMTGAVRVLLNDERARAACEARGAEVAATYAPTVVVDELVSAYRSVLETKRVRGALKEHARAARRR
jgi:glycosyltransferase involved in cell wall biosynthesis